ncbi:MAG TPA: DUF2460 domain-containing protein [Salinarimonas sp.]|nr:DUF2460 domain-containing protein [Salinarimonas sp.]
MMADFHEVRFPFCVALGARGGPVRATEIVTLASGREHRNARHAHARRRWDAGLGIRTLDALHEVVTFFEERRGRLHGFRFRDAVDWKSGPPLAQPTPLDQRIGTGDGATTAFPLVKTYGGAHAPYVRPIAKPVAGSVRIAVDGVELNAVQGSCDPVTGLVSLSVPPPPGAIVTAGFLFDVPVRFDTDELTLDLSAFQAGEAPHVPLIEIVV